MEKQKSSQKSIIAALAGNVVVTGLFFVLAFTSRSNAFLLSAILISVLTIVDLVFAAFQHTRDKVFRAMELITLFLVIAAGTAVFTTALISKRFVTLQRVGYYHLVILVTVFIVSIILDKYIKHNEIGDDYSRAVLKNARITLNDAKILSVLEAVTAVLLLTNVYDAMKILSIVTAVLFYYVIVMIIVSIAVRLIRKELYERPLITILLPFLGSGSDDLSVLGFLEKNTGITLKNLWSLKYLKKILPFAILISLALFWISTGIVYVESNQEGVVYRFGKLQEKTLSPGLHLTLPYPLDRSEVIDTKTVQSVSIGFQTKDWRTSNVWTEGHDGTEYRFLLGSGNELVSLNLRVEFRISDVKQFVKKSAAPSKIVEAIAYELATDRTMNTDLDTLLAVDREAFTSRFMEDIAKRVEESGTGVEVVSVVMESIHPPVEVASVYQESIAVGIDAERILKEAQGSAAVKLWEAEMERARVIGAADKAYYRKISEAKSSVSGFMASVAAYKEEPEAYTYYKYLSAISSTYKNANLVILGEGIDGSRIYWGSLDASKLE